MSSHQHDLAPFRHSHHFNDDANAATRTRALWWVTWITLATMALELVAGYWAGSLALVAEDSCKFLGILAWGLYFVLTGRDITLSILAARPAEMGHPALVGAGPDRYGQP